MGVIAQIPMKDNTDKPFPKLMKHREGTIILFTEKYTGVVVFATVHEDFVGKYADDWDMYDFSDYTDTVTLSNE